VAYLGAYRGCGVAVDDPFVTGRAAEAVVVARATTDEHGLATLLVVLPNQTRVGLDWLCAGGEFEVVVMPEPSPALESNDDGRSFAEQVRVGGVPTLTVHGMTAAAHCTTFDSLLSIDSRGCSCVWSLSCFHSRAWRASRSPACLPSQYRQRRWTRWSKCSRLLRSVPLPMRTK
jgi:hypothetical protein